MKIFLIAAGIVAGMILLVIVIGAMLPRQHSATRSAFIKASPEKVFELISGPQDWRADLKNCAVVDQDGKHLVRETDKHGQTITYERVQFDPPTLLQNVIADKKSSLWRRVDLESAGAEGRLPVTITEDGEVYNPLFRFVSRFVIGHTRTLDNYLTQLAQVAESRR
jgi:hypothetical protein